jgi:hypothetical protein
MGRICKVQWGIARHVSPFVAPVAAVDWSNAGVAEVESYVAD